MFQECFMRYPGFKTKALTLSYDDGVVQDRHMLECLNRHGLRCTFNLNSGIQESGRIPASEMPALYQGHEIAVHTLTHPHLDYLTPGQTAYQIIRDRENLETLFQCPVEGMAYPFGLNEIPGLIDAIRGCGIRYGRTTVSTEQFGLPSDYLRWNPTCHHSNPRLVDLFQRFSAPDDWDHPWRITCKLMYIWGHSYEFDGQWETLESMCDLISGHEEIWYATNGEIINYLDAYRQLRSSVDGTIVFNPTATTLYLYLAGQNLELAPGQTIRLQDLTRKD